MTGCMSGCLGIDLGDGNHSGCDCGAYKSEKRGYNSRGDACDCPQHPTLEKPGRCGQPMWWGYGAPAGLCGEAAFGPSTPEAKTSWRMACPNHGGPPPPNKARS